MLYFIVFFGTLARKRTEIPMLALPESEVYLDEKRVPFLDKFKPWLAIMAFVLLLAYVPAAYQINKNNAPKAPPYQINNPSPDTLTVSKK